MIDRKNGDKPITFEVTIGECWAHGGGFWAVTAKPCTIALGGGKL